jgi:hypothetical protein
MILNSKVEEVLISMGYRSMDKSKTKWGKPLGYTLIFIELDVMQISQLMHNNLGELSTWDRDTLDEDPAKMLDGIMSFEAWKLHSGDLGHASGKRFNFISQAELVACIL